MNEMHQGLVGDHLLEARSLGYELAVGKVAPLSQIDNALDRSALC